MTVSHSKFSQILMPWLRRVTLIASDISVRYGVVGCPLQITDLWSVHQKQQQQTQACQNFKNMQLLNMKKVKAKVNNLAFCACLIPYYVMNIQLLNIAASWLRQSIKLNKNRELSQTMYCIGNGTASRVNLQNNKKKD
jgi:uroporphyrinogen-III decarboxylase